jgi:putative endonuclease
MHYVYIIFSKNAEVYYKGETATPIKRLVQHNQNLSKYTSGKGPWELVYLEELNSRTEALVREKSLKRQNRKYLQWLSNNLLTY